MRTMREFWQTVAASVQVQQWAAEHGPAPDGKGWSGEWQRDDDGVMQFKGAVLVDVAGFPIAGRSA